MQIRFFARRSLFSYFAAVCLLWLFTANGLALDYFSAEVPVKSQSQSAQTQAAQQGLIDVLVRISGSEDVRDIPQIIQQSKRARSFVSQFQFADVSDPELEAEGYSHILKLSYSGRLVRKLLADAGSRIWSISRPNTLVWLVEDSAEEGKQMLTFDPSNALFKGLQEALDYRGLPVTYPLLDFEDQVALGAERLWALDEQAIFSASERYKADTILVGKYSVTSLGEVLSSWQFYHRNRSRGYDLRAESPRAIGYDAVLPLADFLATSYSYQADEAEYFSMRITNVRSFADYRRLLETLEAFDTISEIKLDHVENGRVALRLRSEVSIEQLKSQLTLRRKLNVDSNSETTNQLPAWERAELGSPQNPLLYRWQR